MVLPPDMKLRYFKNKYKVESVQFGAVRSF